VESLLEIIKGALAQGDDVLVSGFGKFCVKCKDERKGRNPATGEDMMLRSRKVVTFKCSGKLRRKGGSLNSKSLIHLTRHLRRMVSVIGCDRILSQYISGRHISVIDSISQCNLQ
jgi:nucleoid DNA-binding protein